MTYTTKINRAVGTGFLGALLVLAAKAQTEPPPTPPSASSTVPVVAGTPAAKPGEAVILNPFEVQASPDKSYGTLNSNAITRFQTELNKMPVSADIFDQRFMKDINATSVEQMIGAFSASSGLASSTPDTAAGASQALDRNANSTLSFRGLASTAIERDGFFPFSDGQIGESAGTLFTPVFDLENAEVILGPQSLLYGVGGGGGVENLVSKQARFSLPAFGIAQFQVDQYGDKLGTVDLGASTDRVALRVDAINQAVGGRRDNIGGPLTGAYAQLAFKPLENTTVRAQAEETEFTRFSNDTATLTALSTANDARNSQDLHYLLATNQIVAAANGGASGAGVIDNGNINWNNIDSFAGDTNGEYTKNDFTYATVDTVWTPSLSTEVAGGYDSHLDTKVGNTATAFIAPNVAANTTGTWAAGQTSVSPLQDLWEPSRTKVLRVSGLLTNDLFGGRAHSQTTFGGDYSRVDAATISYNYVQADSNFNPIVGTSTKNNGLTFLPSLYWSVAGGPVKYPLDNFYTPREAHITYQGINYVREISQAPNAALISPSNPLGLTGTGSGDFRLEKNMNKGLYFANYTDWLDGKLTTLVGARAVNAFAQQINENSGNTKQPSVTAPSSLLYAKGISYSAGVNYELLPWLRPYVEVSSSYNPPQTEAADPYGNYPLVSTAVGEEAGFKFTNEAKTFSGALSVYHANSKNEETSFTSTITTDINPAGLNGQYGAPSVWVNVNRASSGAELSFTSDIIKDLRMRLSADYTSGTINSNKSYAQLYNDQFYENGAGQVTYQDGTLVYVSSTTTKATISTAGAAGAVPLTVALMNSSSSVYYASPAAVTGAISSTSGAATILKTIDPVHGPILTGAVGLPISDLQIAPLAGAAPPGVIPIAETGDISAGYPQFSLNYTAVHQFSSGPLNGFEFGGSVTAYWKSSEYYYYPVGLVNNPNSRTMLYKPDEWNLSGIFGYTRRFRKVTVSTQLNISNIFNHYHIIVLPSYVNGWAGPGDNATFDADPRSYNWSVAVGF